ncbi:hypothetical protein PS783_37505 (plasmid) [Streptomyces enissocaesilis]|nr:hypothetical protein PS783_37505 [Streptomyces enissocaesilis]
MPFSTPAATAAATAFKVDDFVLYRDPEMFWAGKPGHTVVCRVTYAERYTSDKIPYMRLLPPLDAMRDIDTAPLNTADAADGMTAAAMAWLAQQHATASTPPELPAPRG